MPRRRLNVDSSAQARYLAQDVTVLILRILLNYPFLFLFAFLTVLTA